MSDGPSRDEFAAFTGRIYSQMDDGFKGVHDRLDVLNGRTGKGEVADAELRARLTSVEKEVFAVPHRRVSDSDAREPGSWFSKRDTALVGIGLGLLATMLKIALLLGDAAIDAFQHALKVK